jgi:hypothetical protein
MPNQPARSDRRGRSGDLVVGHAEEDRVCVCGVGAPPERAIDHKFRQFAERLAQRTPESPPAHEGQATRRVDGGTLPFQFPHLRYRSVG